MTDVKEDYTKHYSENNFWAKIVKYGKKAGVSVTYVALLLFYTAKKPAIPAKVKTTIYGALGYFILPLDIIPDITPGVGFTDDLSALIVALVVIATYIDDETKQLAKTKLVDWFGENALKDVTSIDNKLKDKQQDNKENEQTQ